MNFWKEDLPAENDTFEGENWILFDALIRSLDEKRKKNKVIEFSLDNAGAEVATTIPEYITNKLSKKSKWKPFPEKLKWDNKTNLLHTEYFRSIFTWWIKSTATLVGFAI